MLAIKILIFAFATCATPGPVNLLASLSGAHYGLRPNTPFVLGATLGLSAVIIVAGLGVSQLLKTNEYLANALTLIGSGYMLYLAFKMAKANVEINLENKDTVPNFYQGAVLQIINPKAWLVSMAGIAMYINTAEYISSLILYVVAFFFACFASVFLWVYLGRLIATKLRISHFSIFNRTMAGLLVSLISYNLFDTFSPYFYS